jgi:hypothetical protein
MGKRIGANERKRKSERTRRHCPGLIRFCCAGATLLAVCGGAAVLYGKYEGRLQDLRNMVENIRNTNVDSITITGAVHLTPAEIMKRSGIRLPVAFDRLKRDGGDAVRETSPWFETVTFARTHKGAVTIVIRERRPVAMQQTARSGKLSLVDAHGACLPIDPRVSLDLPLVSGLADSVDDGGARTLTKNDCGRMVAFFASVAAFDSSFARRITQVNFSPLHTIRLVLAGSPTTIVVDESDIAGRLQRFRQLQETLLADSLPPSRVDLTYRNLAFVTAQSVPDAAVAAEKKKKG